MFMFNFLFIAARVVNTVQPGLVNGEPAQDLLALSADADTVAAKVGEKGAGDVVEIFLRMVPPNIIKAATEIGRTSMEKLNPAVGASC